LCQNHWWLLPPSEEAVNDELQISRPPALVALERDSLAAGFTMASEPRTGALLRSLAASKPGGAILEVGTGTGISTAWILDGMDSVTRLVTIEYQESHAVIARRHLGHDPRVSFNLGDGAEFIKTLEGRRFDMIFADTWPGKFDHLEEALDLLGRGGFYVIDDLLPQASWPAEHAAKVPALIADLERRSEFVLCKLAWSSGIVVAVRR
jgi:predicted O-methyltransferase YrrM